MKKESKLSEKKNYRYLGILEADNIKQVELKGKIEKNTSGERENYSKPDDLTRISSKG